MEGERILKSLLNGNKDHLLDDTKNYLAPFETTFESKNGCRAGAALADETVSKYSVFCTKFLRCAVETLKKVKSKGDDLDEISTSLNLVSTLLNKTLTSDNGKYLKYIPSLDQLGKTLYLLVVQLLSKSLFDQAFSHASHLLKYLQLLRKRKSYGTDKTAKEFTSIASRISETLLQGSAKLEATKVTAVERASHLCLVLEWRKLSLLFQAESVSVSSVKCLVDRTLKCGTKYQLDCGQKNVSHKTLASFFETVLNTLLAKKDLLLKKNGEGSEALFSFVELGFHFGRICHKASKQKDALTLFDKLLDITKELNPSPNGHTNMPLQICFCVCSICKAAILVSCTGFKDLRAETQDSVNKLLLQSVDILCQVTKSQLMTSSILKLLSDSLEYFRITLQNLCNKHTDSQSATGYGTSCLRSRIFQAVEQSLQLYFAVLDLQCEQLKVELLKAGSDATALQLRQQFDRAVERQLSVSNFIISLYQDQLKSEKDLTVSDKDFRLQITHNCLPIAQQASELIHNALVDSEMFSLSAKELRWLGCNIYNLGCLLYQSDSFSEAVPLLALACDNLKAWCFAAEGEDLGRVRTEEIKLLTKYTLLSDCQRRARQFTNALATATTQVLVGLQMSSDREIIRQQVKQWTAAKHELVKSLQDEEKHFERERTLCTALAEQNDALDIVGSQLSLVLEEELACYRAKSYDSTIEETAVIRQLMELYSVEDDTFHVGSSTLEFAIVLHSMDDDDSAEYKQSLEYCQEAVEILKQLSDESENQEAINGCHLSAVQDRLAAAYMWRAVLEHELSIKQAKISDDYDCDEVKAVSLEQPFMLSLHSALNKWTNLAKNAMLESKNGKIVLTHFYNAEETSHYQLITAAFYGLLNQPFNRVQALNLAATIYKAIGTQDALDRALSAYSDAVHSLCDILNVTHACVMLENATDLLGTFEPDGATKVQFLLCKSHHCLVSGKYTEGEECLKEVLNSDIMSQKNYKSHMLTARLSSIAMKYLLLPSDIYELRAIIDPLLGPLTAVEVALDGFRKLSHMGEEIFGEQVFHSGKTTGKEKEHKCEERSCTGKGEGMLISSDGNQSAFQLSVLLDLLTSLLQVGQLYTHQGAVREAYRQFIDGLTLARHFRLPHRIAEFLVSIAQLDVKQGKMDKGKVSLDELKAILQPLLKLSSKKKHLKEGMEVTTFLEHPKECDCNRCADVALHFIVIDYFLIQSSYLACSSRPELSISTLEEADVVCEATEQKIIASLEKLNENIGQEQKIDVYRNSKRTKKKGKSCNTVQAAKALKQGLALQSSSISQLMLSKHCASLYFINAKLLLHNGKTEKAKEVLSGALEFLAVTEKVSSLQVATLFIKASLIHLCGLADLLCVIESHSYGVFHSRWFLGNGEDKFLTTNTASRTKQTVLPLPAQNREEKVSKPRKGSSSTNTKNPKSAKTRSTKGNSRKKQSVASSTGKKKMQEDSSECNHCHDEAKGNEQVNGEETDSKGSRYLHQAIQSLNQALALYHSCPPPELFSNVCQALAFCHGRSFPRLAMHYLNLSSSVSLRHKAVSSLGKRLRRLAKDALFSSSLGDNKCMTRLVHQLSSLSLQENPSSGMSSDMCERLKHLIVERNVMMFKSNCLKEDDFHIVDEEISFVQSIPKEWTVCMLELFQLPGRQDKELMICRLRAGSEPVFVKINTLAGEEKARDSAANSSVDHVVMDLTKLFQCSVEEEFNDIMSDSIKSMSVDDTSEWWTQRTRLDNRMKNLLERIETSWLGRWKGILLGKPVNKDCHDSVKDAAKHLQERIEQMLGNTPDLQLLEVIIDSSSHMSKMEIKEAFLEILGLNEVSPLFKDIMLVFEEITASLLSPGNKKAKGKKTKSNIHPVPRNPVILILGKGIQQLPWESIPILYNQPVTRVPSLQFLLSKVSCQKQLSLVNPMKTFYMLNPQNNLPNTQKMFQKWFESENGWQGISGSAPSQKEFSSALTDHELFIYFGHGTGREFLIGDDIQRLDCQAVTLLMGCSSGKLMVEGECEPRGMVLNYLIAGCPAIVANLWDVTDKDIDRFSESLLKLWLQQREYLSLPEALSQSRQACRLKYLIGASPVVYGLPVYTKD